MSAIFETCSRCHDIVELVDIIFVDILLVIKIEYARCLASYQMT